MTIAVTFDSKVRIAFTVTNDARGDAFTDAMYFPAGQVPTNSVLRQMAQDRYLAWLAIATAPPHVPTLAEKVAAYLARKEQRQILQVQIDGEDPAVVAAAG